MAMHWLPSRIDERGRLAHPMRLSRLVFAWVVVVVLGAGLQWASASSAAAHPPPSVHAVHEHTLGAAVKPAPAASEAAVQGAPAGLHAPDKQLMQAELRASSGWQATPCPERCGGECEAGGSCCPAGGMTLLSTADMDIHVAVASASRVAMPQDDVSVSGLVYLIARPPKPIG